jgi:hypothetical protein
VRAGVRRGVQRAVKLAVPRPVGEALALALGVAASVGRDTNRPAGTEPEPEDRGVPDLRKRGCLSSQTSTAPGGAAPPHLSGGLGLW